MKTVAGLEGRQLDEAVSERWAQVIAQRLENPASSRPSRASREKAIRDIAMGVQFEKVSGRKRFFEEPEEYSGPKAKRAKPKAVSDLRARARTKGKASESEMSMVGTRMPSLGHAHRDVLPYRTLSCGPSPSKYWPEKAETTFQVNVIFSGNCRK